MSNQEVTTISDEPKTPAILVPEVLTDDIDFDVYSINEMYDTAIAAIQEPKNLVIVVDFEMSYTYFFMDKLVELAGSKDILKHFIMQYGSQHTWDHAESWPYKAQWMLGFYIDNQFFWISNLLKYREKSKAFLQELRKVLPNKRLVGQNIKFDLKVLIEIMDLTPREVLDIRVYDLMTMGYALDLTAKRFSLSIAAERHLPIHGKGDRKYYYIDGEYIEIGWKHDEDFHRTLMVDRLNETIKYNREDLLITKELFYVLWDKLKDKGISRSAQIYSWFVPFYTLLEMTGLKIDLDRAQTAFFQSAEDGRMAELRICEASKEIFQLLKAQGKHQTLIKNIPDLVEFDRKFAFFSRETFTFKDDAEHSFVISKGELSFATQKTYLSLNTISGSAFRELISTVIADCFGFDVARTKTGYAFQRDNMKLITERLALSSDELSLKISKLLKDMLLLNSLKANLARVRAFYLLPCKLYHDHRLHSEFKILGTETGRISSVRPGIMNMPLRLKELVIADGKIVQLDLKSAEAKLFMLLTQNREILEEIIKTDDTYSVVGMRVFELDEMSKKTRPIERNIMKIGVLAKMYGQSIYGLATQVEIYYQPVRWEIYMERQKYHFVYKWNCISFDEAAVPKLEALATQIRETTAAQLQRLQSLLIDHETDLREILHNPKLDIMSSKLDDLCYFASKTQVADPDAQKLLSTAADLTELKELRQRLGDQITLDYFTIASISNDRLEKAIDAGKYEDWVCRTFFNIDEPLKSYIESPVGLIRNFNMTAEDLIREKLSDSQREDVYTILVDAYRAFFLNLQPFTGSFWTGTSHIDIEVFRLHALTALSKMMSRPMNGKSLFTWMYEKICTALGHENDDEFMTLLMRTVNDSETNFAFQRAVARLSARYREALNLPIQGPSSFINSYLGFKAYIACLDQGLDIKVVNTIHDAVHYEVNTLEDIPAFKTIVTSVYEDMELLKNLLGPGLRSIHPNKEELFYIPIGGDIEVCDRLSEAK
jgi:DNA polymerase I-like protein with 3'-5' exonuclease and polymerase domains